jgi:hypothetical protein
MEVSVSGEIVQVRGRRNAGMTEEVKEFVEYYKLHLAEVFSKNRRKTA